MCIIFELPDLLAEKHGFLERFAFHAPLLRLLRLILVTVIGVEQPVFATCSAHGRLRFLASIHQVEFL